MVFTKCSLRGASRKGSRGQRPRPLLPWRQGAAPQRVGPAWRCLGGPGGVKTAFPCPCDDRKCAWRHETPGRSPKITVCRPSGGGSPVPSLPRQGAPRWYKRPMSLQHHLPSSDLPERPEVEILRRGWLLSQGSHRPFALHGNAKGALLRYTPPARPIIYGLNLFPVNSAAPNAQNPSPWVPPPSCFRLLPLVPRMGTPERRKALLDSLVKSRIMRMASSVPYLQPYEVQTRL